MPLSDDADLREFLQTLYPELTINGVAAESGQRVVYFCQFSPTDSEDHPRAEWHKWGEVVLKISEGLSAQVIAYLQREIEILNSLDHPGYPSLYFDEVIIDDPETEERLRYKRYITIEEKIESQPLSAIKDRYQTEKDVLELLEKIIIVLKPLWEWDPPLIHRDIKPENILITPKGDVVIIDLGIAREEGSSGETATGAEYGPCTPRYASPEQAKNDKLNITFKSDLFSIGTLCYELMTGSNPFDDGTLLLEDVLSNVVSHNPDPLSGCCDCSAAFSSLISRMMEKQPYKRHRRINEVLTDIETIKGNRE